MSNDKWTERLSEYLDGELNETERDALETHLEDCAECAAALGDLQTVVARAGSLDDRPPSRDLWSGIAERIGSAAGTGATEVRPIESAVSRKRNLFSRSITIRMPQLAAAAVALIVVSGTLVGGFVAIRDDVTASQSGTPRPGPEPGGAVVATSASFAGARYDSAVVELEDALAANRGQLDTATVRIIRQNLGIIDQAIDQARSALLADPGSVYLSNHLAGTLKRKMELLRFATALTATQS